LCEKPLALQRKQALGVVTAAQRSGVIFMVAQVIRFWDEYAFLKKCLLEKTYGALKQAWFSRTGSAPMWSWDGWFLTRNAVDWRRSTCTSMIPILFIICWASRRACAAPDL